MHLHRLQRTEFRSAREEVSSYLADLLVRTLGVYASVRVRATGGGSPKW